MNTHVLITSSADFVEQFACVSDLGRGHFSKCWLGVVRLFKLTRITHLDLDKCLKISSALHYRNFIIGYVE